MPPPNLTRIAAKQRAALLTVADYAVELDLTDGSGGPGEATYATTTTVRFACRQPGAGCWIDFVGAGVRSAVLNGRELDVSGYREDEGITLVLTRDEADAAGLRPEWAAARITLRVDSTVTDVGLTAAVSSRLAARGIACNIVAGLAHDHLFVPEDRGAEAFELLQQLAREATSR